MAGFQQLAAGPRWPDYWTHVRIMQPLFKLPSLPAGSSSQNDQLLAQVPAAPAEELVVQPPAPLCFSDSPGLHTRLGFALST